MVLLFFVIVSCKNESSDTPSPEAQEVEKDVFASVEHLGVCYGPYHNDGQAPLDTAISKAQMEADLTLISKNFDFFRTYTVADSMDQVVGIAASLGLELALGAHCYPDDSVTTIAEIDKAIMAAKQHPSTVMCIVIGNETNLKYQNPNYVPPAKVAEYMDYAHTKMIAEGLDMPLSACITGTGADDKNTYPHEDYAGPILQKCKDLNKVHHRLIFLTIYPYFGAGSNPANIDGNMQWSYEHGMSNAEDNFDLCVMIGEIGWPSANDGKPTSRENVANMETNFKASLNWVDGKNIYNKAYNSFWFEMFDEPWKVKYGPIESYWGLYEKNGAQTPKFPIPDLH